VAKLNVLFLTVVIIQVDTVGRTDPHPGKPQQFYECVGSGSKLELSKILDELIGVFGGKHRRSSVLVFRQRRHQYLFVRSSCYGIDLFAPPDEDTDRRQLCDQRDVVEITVITPPHLVSLKIAPAQCIQILYIFYVRTPPHKVFESVVVCLDGRVRYLLFALFEIHFLRVGWLDGFKIVFAHGYYVKRKGRVGLSLNSPDEQSPNNRLAVALSADFVR